MSLWGEIRRRNVHRVAIAYVATAWLLIQVAETLFPVFGLSDMAIRAVVMVLAVGLVLAVILSWVFEWTPEGLRRDSDVAVASPAKGTRRFDAAIIAMLVLAVAYFSVDKFVFDPVRDRDREVKVAAEARGEAIIAEELLNLLAGVPELRVVGRTSAFSFKDNPATIPEIGEALGVTYIVEGSVRTAADRIRITVQLVEAASDTHLFSQNYDRDFGDIFDIQDEVAAKVVDELQISLVGGEPHAKRVDPRAYALYLQARTIFNDSSATDADFDRMRSLIERALEIEPNYGEALALYSRYLWIVGEEDVPPAQTYERIRRMSTRALAIDPDNANALQELAAIALFVDNDIETAARFTKRAHEADPANFEMLWGSMKALGLFGRSDLAARIGEYVIERDPLCMRCYTDLAEIYMQLGDQVSARRVLGDALALEPGWFWGQLELGRTFLLSGQPETAWETMPEIGPDDGSQYPGHLEVLHDLGRHEEFETLLPGFVEWHGENGFALINAQLYAWIGDKDEAFRWLDEHDRENSYVIRLHLTRPWYRKLYDDPRWQALLEQYQMTDEILESLDLDIRLPPGTEL
jgi:TolB-like protein/tetratricopeptide (TPR) repeat protein